MPLKIDILEGNEEGFVGGCGALRRVDGRLLNIVWVVCEYVFWQKFTLVCWWMAVLCNIWVMGMAADDV